MDIRPSFNAPEIFHSLAQGSHVSNETKQKLGTLEELTTHLFFNLDQKNVDKNKVLTDVCSIASQWRSLIRENNLEIGSDFNRLKLFHAFENVLDKVKLVMTEKQTEAYRKNNERSENDNVGNWILVGLMKTAVATTHFSLEILNQAPFMPKEYQNEMHNWVNDTQDKFIAYSSLLFKREEGEEMTFEHILEGVEKWQQFVNAAHRPETTDIRISQLKESVAEQFDSFLMDDDVENQMATHFQGVKNQHKELVEKTKKAGIEPIEIFAGARDLLFPPEMEESFLDHLLNYESHLLEMQQFIRGQAEAAIADIHHKIADGTQAIKNEGLLAIENIQSTAQVVINFITKEGNKHYATLITKKNEYIAKQLQAYTPKQLFEKMGNPTFMQFLEAYLEPLVFNSLKQQIVSNLQANLSTLLEEQNVKRLGNTVLNGLINGLITLHAGENKNSEEILGILIKAEKQNPIGKNSEIPLNLEDYKEMVSKKVADRLAFLVIKPKENEPDSPKQGMFKKTINWLFGDKSPLSNPASSSPEGSPRSRLSSSPTLVSELFEEKIDLQAYMKTKLVGKIIEGHLECGLTEVDKEIDKAVNQLFLKMQIAKKELNKFSKERDFSEEGSISISGELDRVYQLISRNAIDLVIKHFKIETFLKELNGRSDVVFYYILDKVSQEIKNILTGQDTKMNRGITSLKESVENFKRSEDSTFLKAIDALNPILQPSFSFLEMQGDSQSIFDITTPIVSSVLPKWQDWISE